jgi:hypothetical protein
MLDKKRQVIVIIVKECCYMYGLRGEFLDHFLLSCEVVGLVGISFPFFGDRVGKVLTRVIG